MKKTIIVQGLIITSFSISTLGSIVQATSYPSATEAISDVNVSIILGSGPEIPSPGPGFPELPELPLPENPEISHLSLRYVSNINFGDSFVSAEDQIISSKKDINGAFPMVTVQDYRKDEDRYGWHLTVKQERELLNGAQIKMTPSIDMDVANKLEIKMSAEELRLNDSGQIYATTTNNPDESNVAGIASMPMGTSSRGVELMIPNTTASGEYSTSIIWNLVNGPELTK